MSLQNQMCIAGIPIRTALRWSSSVIWFLLFSCGSAARQRLDTMPASEPGSPTAMSKPLGPSISDVSKRVAQLETAEAAGEIVERQSPLERRAPGKPTDPGGMAVGAANQTAASEPEQTARAGAVQPMMDIEARLAIEVKDVSASLNEVRQLVANAGGQILQESLEDARRERPKVQLTARVPSAGAFDFLSRLEAAGVVRSRQVNSRDVGKEYFDATLRLGALERVLVRYQELLSKANTIEETLRVEEQISRISGEIESIKGELRWLKDRVARATVHLELYAKGDWAEPVVTPEAKFYPGIRAVGSWDWRGDAGNRYGLGAGLSLRFSRYFSIDFDGLQNTNAKGGNLELTMLTLGGELYSDFLGAGQRRWLNPYVGLRGGYARIDGNNQVIAGGTLGMEIFKNSLAVLNLDLRLLGAFGGDPGSHLIVVPAFGLNVAF